MIRELFDKYKIFVIGIIILLIVVLFALKFSGGILPFF